MASSRSGRGLAWLAALATSAAASAPASLAPAPAGPPARWHFSFRGDLEISVLFWRNASGDDTRLLVRHGRRRLTLVSRQDPSGLDSSEAIGFLGAGAPEVLERRLVLPGAPFPAGCEAVRPPDACVVFTGAGGPFAAAFSAFSGPRAAEARERAAALVPPALREAVFDLAPVLPVLTEFGSYTKDFLGLVWPDRFSGPQRAEKGTRGKGCAFDAAFGYPCDAAERGRESRRFPAGAD